VSAEGGGEEEEKEEEEERRRRRRRRGKCAHCVEFSSLINSRVSLVSAAVKL